MAASTERAMLSHARTTATLSSDSPVRRRPDARIFFRLADASTSATTAKTTGSTTNDATARTRAAIAVTSVAGGPEPGGVAVGDLPGSGAWFVIVCSFRHPVDPAERPHPYARRLASGLRRSPRIRRLRRHGSWHAEPTVRTNAKGDDDDPPTEPGCRTRPDPPVPSVSARRQVETGW